MIRRIRDSASNIRIFGFDRIKMPFTVHTHQCGFTHPVGFYTLGVSTSTSTTTSNSTSTSTSNSNSTSTSTLSQRNSKLRKLQVRETPSRRNSKSQENSKSEKLQV